MPSEEADEALRGKTLTKYTENTITSKKEFKAMLKEVKSKGYAIDNSEDIQGINCVGAPIFNEHGYPVAALWITAPYGRLPASQFESKGKIIQKYAMKISTKLGYLTQSL
ncbi:IclR family transcriptional regulator [Zobellia laminariae]|uniref:IclR family transcriptional regulator n=1 Tax=Zobellia laminariae TaxID=248906 RepID=UPI0026F44E42|nr:IclR family transcriptional regulator C-terminal domain-containing protein [Zobellia laminariae]WKX78639.1 IclR family transcriptional regulator C-terminal domain-containing protein [Zobellia laminariae]